MSYLKTSRETDAEPLPPEPEQEISKVNVPADSNENVSEPLVPFVPVHALDAVQPVAFVDDHVTVTVAPT